jgi:adenosine deaminase
MMVAEFRRLPKLDLHVHLDGAVRTRTILELARTQGVPLPARSVRGLVPHVTVGPSCRSLRAFLKTFETFYEVLRSPDAVARVSHELCEDQAGDGVRYFETRFAPSLLAGPRGTMLEIVRAALAGLERGKRTFGVRWGLILCLYRGDPPETAAEVVRIAHRLRGRGVVGVDVAGDEGRHGLEPLAEALAEARRRGIPITIHAGEAGSARNVVEAVERYGARRIGHGTRLAQDRAAAERIRARGTVLELCLTSNVQTGAVRALARHPLPLFRKWGLPVTLNTDDPAVSRITLSGEYALAHRTFGLSRADFRDLLETAARASFAPRGVMRSVWREVSRSWRNAAWS